MKLINDSISLNNYGKTKLKNSNMNQSFKDLKAQPIRDLQRNVSFKGVGSLFYKKVTYYDYKKLLKIASSEIGEAGNDLLERLRNKGADKAGKLIEEVEGKVEHSSGIKTQDSITFREDTFLKQLVDSVTFPVRELPFLISDFMLDIFKKVPGLKSPAKKLYDSELLSKRRSAYQAKEDVNKIKGLIGRTEDLVNNAIEKKEDGINSIDDILSAIEKKSNTDKKPILKSISDGLFTTANKYFDPKTGNYNTVHERSLNRIVSGLIPATFLANDAYNLSVLCKDSKETSDKEKKTRFHQEVSRVLTNAYIQLITLGALTKYVNKSPIFSAGVSAATVLVAETFSRWLNGRPVTFVSSEKAKEINKKEALKDKKTSDTAANPDEKTKKNDNSPQKVNFGEKQKEIKNPEKEQKSVVTLNNLLKLCGAIVFGGTAISFLRNGKMFKIESKVEKNKYDFDPDKYFKSVSKYWKEKIYNKLTQKDFEISKDDYELVLKKLEEAGQKNLAAKYREVIGNVDGKETIKLIKKTEAKINDKGEITKKAEKEAVKINNKFKPYLDIVVYPFDFAFKAIKLPYNIVKNLLCAPVNPILKDVVDNPKTASESAKKIADIYKQVFGVEYKSKEKIKSVEEVFLSSIDKLVDKVNKLKKLQNEKLENEEFNKFVNSSVMSSFNSTSKSNYSNTDLANITKLASSTVTSAFLVADNYNMVMLKSNGENKEEAKQRAKERVVQRVSALFYQTMLMNWFNTTFNNQYHSSLMGMSGVVSVNTVATEIFTRKSIGMPLGAKSYEELAEIEDKNLNRKGFLGSYFRFMSKLTGKKALASKQPENPETLSNPQNTDAFTLLHNESKKPDTTDLLMMYGKK